MSTDAPTPRNIKDLVDEATALGQRAYAQAFDRVNAVGGTVGAAAGAASGSAAGSVPPRVADLANGTTSTLLGLAEDVVGLALHAAVQIGGSLVDAAGELEKVLGRDGPMTRDAGDGPTAAAPSALALPDSTRGAQSHATFDVRNSGLDTVDAIGLRCSGLFATGDARIEGGHVAFAPSTIELLPGATATVTCSVEVPAKAKRGHYVGLIEATGLTGVQLLVTLDVR